MTDLAMNFVVTPLSYVRSFFSGAWKSLNYSLTLSGMARAAEQLRRMGHEKEAQYLYEQMRNLKVE